MNNYDVVPDIITGKDLDYLSDMFEWNYGALKCTNNSIIEVQDMDIVKVLEKAKRTFDDNLNDILNTLQKGVNNE